MANPPKRFCEFQGEYDPEYRKYCCIIGDWQCSAPLCFYRSKRNMPNRGCEIANLEGTAINIVQATSPSHACNTEMSPCRALEIILGTLS